MGSISMVQTEKEVVFILLLSPLRYEVEGKILTKCGVSISNEQCNITHWRITDAEANVIEYKDFLSE